MRDNGASLAGRSDRGPAIEDRQDASMERYYGPWKCSMRALIEFTRS
jgi:hypothetical protein